MLAASAIYTPKTITRHDPQHSHADTPDAGEWPTLLQQSLAMWERIFAHQTGATAPSAPPPLSPAPTETTTDQSQGACAP